MATGDRRGRPPGRPAPPAAQAAVAQEKLQLQLEAVRKEADRQEAQAKGEAAAGMPDPSSGLQLEALARGIVGPEQAAAGRLAHVGEHAPRRGVLRLHVQRLDAAREGRHQVRLAGLAHARHSAERQKVRRRALLQRLPAVGLRLARCLLYTSDAADE